MSSFLPFFPESASSSAPYVDAVTVGLIIISGLIVLLVFGLIAFFGIRYHKGSPHSRKIRWGGKHVLEWAWTFATLFGFLCLFAWGATVYFDLHSAPPGATEITVIGKQWMWKFQHPDGTRELNQLHVPVDEPILLTMTSQDVIHSFFVPAFRMKQDVVPGRYYHAWFKATKPGTYHLFCTQYCGTEHAEMRGKIIVQTREQYQKWLQTGLTAGSQRGSLSMASHGRELFTKLGCISCHGTAVGVQAPSLAGIYGKPVGLSDGTVVTADENYLRESILNPKAKIVMGYAAIMPPFAQIASEEDVLDLISYIKSLQATPTGAMPPQTGP